MLHNKCSRETNDFWLINEEIGGNGLDNMASLSVQISEKPRPKKGDLIEIVKQDGRLATAYFSHEYKYFDQHLPTVKNEITV